MLPTTFNPYYLTFSPLHKRPIGSPCTHTYPQISSYVCFSSSSPFFLLCPSSADQLRVRTFLHLLLQMALDDPCKLVLGLGLGLASTAADDHGLASSAKVCSRNRSSGLNKCGFSTLSTAAAASAEPCLKLSLSGENYPAVAKKNINDVSVNKSAGEEPFETSRQGSPHSSAVSSFSSGRVVKRERDGLSSEDADAERVSSRMSDEDEDGSNARKKLRLTKEQSALLEESFKQHSTLNPKQKQALARQLNLRPRQVEVWFQNRRARTKLKQTELDCEFLKKCCETLTDENRRLQKELQDLKALKLAQPFYMPVPAATLTMCPSCERNGGVHDGASKTQFSMSTKPHFFNPFANSSAAC